ncbi:Uu.00g015630.m01.CDS01 [Anthostomella pinea]|uniref:Uu.00g015630.m01.CDS01 n=1 Tax=Anthostomella pinea TaxID=933095 RepID=A0AAI8YQC1_9PEZI|nr:Uu.00g015630.m01.CDS01 [Anthostomella pinea]
MFPMEEGVLEGPWNIRGKIVLLGNFASKVYVFRTLPCHMMKQNAGSYIRAGNDQPPPWRNAHVEGVCQFVNELTDFLLETPAPSTEDIMGVFTRFERKSGLVPN